MSQLVVECAGCGRKREVTEAVLAAPDHLILVTPSCSVCHNPGLNPEVRDQLVAALYGDWNSTQQPAGGKRTRNELILALGGSLWKAAP